MVLLHCKRSEGDHFLFETTVEAGVRDTVAALAELNNLRHRINRLKLEGEELAKYGPAKRPDLQGIDTYAEAPVERGPFYNMDPTGRRTGNACDPNVAKVLLKTLEEAAEAAHTKNVERKVAMVKARLLEAIDTVRGAVMICYPAGLPEWDLVRACLEGDEDLAGTSHANDELDPETSTLWFAGKQMAPEKKLADFVGRNERTKAVVKLQRKGAGAPGREPVVDAETQKAMLAFYYKKQEEAKRLAEDADDSYTSAAWASSTSLKQHFSGVSSVRIPR